MAKIIHPRFHSIQVTIAVAFSVLSVTIIVGAILIAYSLTEETARIASQGYTKQLVNQIATNIDSYIDYMNSVSSFVQADKDVQEFLQQNHFTKQAANVLATLVKSRNDISLVGLFSYDGRYITHDPNLRLNPYAQAQGQPWFIAAQRAQGKSVVSSSHVQNVIADRYRWVISLSREILRQDTNQGEGILLVDLNYDIISRICSSVRLGKRGYVFIVDSNGEIVYHPQQQLIYGGLKTENIRQVIEEKNDYFADESPTDDKLYNVQTMKSTGWKVVGVNYRNDLVENRDSIRITFELWGLFFFIFSVVLSIFLSRQLSKPIKQLRKSMQAVEQGNFDVRSDIHSDNEIGDLGKDFNIMVAEIKNLLQRITQEQEQKRKSELKALQMQINPHFLYNTLDSVIWMAEGGKQNEVITMSSALARLFRLSISKGKEIISIGSEVEHVASYLTIQKIRYKDKLDYRIEVDGAIKTYKTVKIILQPLVENAIYHGIKNKETGGTIIISGSKKEDHIELTVWDNGAGMDKKTLERINTLLADRTPVRDSEQDNAPSSHSGLGLRNVDERIKLYFGPEYGLEYESEEDVGTLARIRLPIVEGDLE